MCNTGAAVKKMSANKKIYLMLEKQVQRKIDMKRGYRKKIKVLLEKETRKILRRIFSQGKIEVKKYCKDSPFGCDSLGRDIYDGLKKYISILESRKVHVHALILLGSRAKGNWHPESDVDVTIIASNLPKKRGAFFMIEKLFKLRMRLILSDRPLYLGIEPSNYFCKEEFLELLEKLDINALDALVYGIIVYDDGFWSKAKEKYEEVKKKYNLDDNIIRQKLRAV